MRLPSLLIAAAGYLAAFTWLEHGHVFTNAQTGNIVLFCATAVSGDWAQALRHVPPMLAFVPGIFAARWLQRRGGRHGLPQADVLCLGVEIVILVLVGLLPPGFPEMPVTFSLAFVAALQSAAFEQVDGWSYTSVVTTGNLRSATEALYAHLFGPYDPLASRKAQVFFIIVASFTAGVAAGAVATLVVGRAAIAGTIVLLCLALGCCLRGPSRSANGGVGG